MLAAVVLASTLCIDGVCPEARPFVWISADGSRVIADVVPLEGERVAHRLTVAASDASRDFAPELVLRCDARTWTWSFARVPRQAFELEHPAGDCTLSVRTAGYRGVDRALTSGVIYLQRLPVLSGFVTDARTAAPIEGARLMLPEGNVIATTDARGRFRAIVDDPWPARIRAEAAGRAPRTIDVPKVVADAELAIAMSAGGSVHLMLAPPLGGEAVRWELRDVEEEKVKTGEVAAGVSEVTIDGIDPGMYRVIVAGDGALQRIAIPVRVTEERVAEPVARIEPLRLDLEVTRGNAPFANAEIEMIFRDGAAAWRANVTADASGMAAEEIWQRGTYVASVGLWQDERRVSTAEDEHVMWKLTVPDRIVRGRVVDAATDRGIADANVFLELRSGDLQSTMRTRADKSGAYEFKLVPAGAYSLRTRPPGYEELRTPLANLGEDATLEVRDLRVAAVAGHALHVRNTAGAPIGGASVYVASRNGVRFAGVTNDDGRMTLPLSFDEAGEAYVLPRSGSFARMRFASMADEGIQELGVTVPDGVASLEMRAVSDDGEPIPKVAFILRVNGAVLPADIVAAMNREQGLPLWSDDNGRLLFARMPAGRYEIWPLTSPADRVAASSASPPPAPVNVMLTAGRQEAKLTFKAR